MFEWFRRRRRTTGRALSLRSRGEVDGALRVDFSELAPETHTFLGHAAYVQLGTFETLSDLLAATSDMGYKSALSRAAGAALEKHRSLVDLISDAGNDPDEVMLPFREPLDAFRLATRGARAEETMLTVHLTTGMLEDFSISLAEGYGDVGRRAVRILRGDGGLTPVIDALAATIASDEATASLLALWGRRLVGDTLLAARLSLRPVVREAGGEDRIEPVFTALVSAHSRRMEELGLSA